MKKFTLLLTLFITSFSFSQMKVSNTDKGEQIGVFKSMGITYAELTKYDNLAMFTYRDEKFSKIDDYKTFSFSYSDLDSLYELFANFDNVKKGDSKTVDLDNGDRLVFEYKKTLGKMYAQVFHHDKNDVTGLIRYMTNKQIDKLFNK